MGLRRFSQALLIYPGFHTRSLGLGGYAAVEQRPYSRLHGDATAGRFSTSPHFALSLAISYCSFGPWLFCRRVDAFFSRVTVGVLSTVPKGVVWGSRLGLIAAVPLRILA
jgi:hypothetical protein